MQGRRGGAKGQPSPPSQEAFLDPGGPELKAAEPTRTDSDRTAGEKMGWAASWHLGGFRPPLKGARLPVGRAGPCGEQGRRKRETNVQCG